MIGGIAVYKNKRVLLIGGGGTLGTYTAKELLRLGASVDVLCPEDKTADDERLVFHKGYGTHETLSDLFNKVRYDGIVNFIHYKNPDEYPDIHKLLIKNCEHLIFLSSYRVYADIDHPITESSPRLLDVTEDKEFLKEETYALSKAKCENYLFGECKGEPWTVVRPLISFSERRFDLFMYSQDDIWSYSKGGKLLLPKYAKSLTAGIDWAGNSGKLIANLLFKKEAIGEAYTISSGQNLTWGRIAEIYSKRLSLEIEWCDEERFIKGYPCVMENKKWIYLYDRKFDRLIDNSKALNATGLSASDFVSIDEGLRIELERKAAKNEKN